MSTLLKRQRRKMTLTTMRDNNVENETWNASWMRSTTFQTLYDNVKHEIDKSDEMKEDRQGSKERKKNYRE
eukprot:3234576-Amphidinium_carterae.1